MHKYWLCLLRAKWSVVILFSGQNLIFLLGVVFREKKGSTLEVGDEMVTDDSEASKKPAREEKIGDLGLLVLQDSVGVLNCSLSNKDFICLLPILFLTTNHPGILRNFPGRILVCLL